MPTSNTKTETSCLQPPATNPSHFTCPVAALNQAKTTTGQQEKKRLATHTCALLLPQIWRLPLLSLTRDPVCAHMPELPLVPSMKLLETARSPRCQQAP